MNPLDPRHYLSDHSIRQVLAAQSDPSDNVNSRNEGDGGVIELDAA